MDYFFSVPNTPYYQWQIDLLIESFKNIGMEKDLIICLIQNKDSVVVENTFLKNILNHKKVYNVSDIGTSKGYAPLSKWYLIPKFIKENLLTQPFIMCLEPDLVIKNDLKISFNKKYVEFLYSVDPLLTFEKAEKHCPNFWELLNLNKKDCEDNWISLGNLFLFNNFPQIFFEKLISVTEQLIVSQILEDKEIWEHTLKLGLILSLLETKSKVVLVKSNSLIMPMTSNMDSNFISYEQGNLPFFHKLMFTYKNPYYFSMGNPIKTLSEIYNSPNVKYISDLAKKCLK